MMNVKDLSHEEFLEKLRSLQVPWQPSPFPLCSWICREAADRIDQLLRTIAEKREHEDTAPHKGCTCKLCYWMGRW